MTSRDISQIVVDNHQVVLIATKHSSYTASNVRNCLGSLRGTCFISCKSGAKIARVTLWLISSFDATAALKCCGFESRTGQLYVCSKNYSELGCHFVFANCVCKVLHT